MATTKWVLDPTHSEILFKIKHLMITNVTGRFDQFAGTIEAENDDFTNAKVEFTAEAGSINTNNEQRDGHLRSADFFDTATHPQLRFVGTRFTKKDDENYVLEGELSMHGETKPVSLNVEFGGVTQDPYGQTKAGFEVSGKINRKDFGLTWGAVTEAGGVVVSDEVRIQAAVQFVKQA